MAILRQKKKNIRFFKGLIWKHIGLIASSSLQIKQIPSINFKVREKLTSWGAAREGWGLKAKHNHEIKTFGSLVFRNSLFFFLSFVFSCICLELSVPPPFPFLESRASSAKNASLAASDFSVASLSARSSKCAWKITLTMPLN